MYENKFAKKKFGHLFGYSLKLPCYVHFLQHTPLITSLVFDTLHFGEQKSYA